MVSLGVVDPKSVELLVVLDVGFARRVLVVIWVFNTRERDRLRENL